MFGWKKKEKTVSQKARRKPLKVVKVAGMKKGTGAISGKHRIMYLPKD